MLQEHDSDSPKNANKAMRLDRRKVLVAEDAPDLQVLTRFYLERNGAQVTMCEDGNAVTEIAFDSDFDCILMDIQMPRKSGFEATKDLRSRGYKGKIVAMTAHAFPGEREKYLDAGFDGFLTKPVLESEIIDAVHLQSQKVKSIYEDDPIVKMAGDMFMKGLPDKFDRLKNNIESRDWDSLVRTSHQIKGSSSSFGFLEMSATAEALENEARGDRNVRVAEVLVAALEKLAAPHMRP
ncbi:MAG: response regulator [Oligoflexales bacterium]